MREKVSYKTIYLTFGILVISFAIASLAIAQWTEPTSAPPEDNVATPLNVGNVGQSKVGGLILNTGGAANGLIVDQGNVGIGTVNPTAKLDIGGTAGVDGIGFPDGTLQTTAGGIVESVYGDPGYVIYANGLIMQWGHTDVPSGEVNVTLPKTNPNATLFVMANRNQNTGISHNANRSTTGWVINNSTIRLRNGYGGTTVNMSWFVIGY